VLEIRIRTFLSDPDPEILTGSRSDPLKVLITITIGGHKFVSSFSFRNDRYKRPPFAKCLKHRNGNELEFLNMRNDVTVSNFHLANLVKERTMEPFHLNKISKRKNKEPLFYFLQQKEREM
jgi:hypothetical protein